MQGMGLFTTTITTSWLIYYRLFSSLVVAIVVTELRITLPAYA